MKLSDLAGLQSPQRWVGQPLRRVEDERVLAGKGCFVDDLQPPGCAYAAFVRSPMARARIAGLNVDAAREVPGVLAVITGEDVAALGELAVNRILPQMRVPARALLARTMVNAVGEPVALVVAETLHAARDAAELVEVDYDALDAVVDTETAKDAPPLYDDLPANDVFSQHWRDGDVDAAFARADRTVSLRLEFPRVAPTSLEPRGALASWDATTRALTVWTSSQTPHRARADLARILGLDVEKVRTIAPDVGGAFGMKASIYPEDALVAWASMQLARPVKWAAMRSEDLLSATHGRGGVVTAELAVANDGALLGLRARVTYPLGLWLPFSAAVPAWNAARILPGPYRVAAVDIHTQGVVTNTAPLGIYRGAGRPEAATVMERLMDEAARALDIDPVELRRRNAVPADGFPHRTPTGQTLDSGDFAMLLERATALTEYRELRAEQARRRAQGELVGIGVSLYVEPCGSGWESARITMNPDGRVIAATGTSPQGQGQRTAFAQIVADELGVAFDAVEVRQGDTRETPTGVGALASRSTAIGGSALKLAAAEVREKMRASAGHEAVEATVVYTAPAEAWSSGCCIAAVSIDADTGELRIERFVWVDDAGMIVNPLLAEGQLIGGFAQGLGQTLMEHVRYDEHGQLLTGTFMDYAVPRADDIPALTIEKVATTSPANALGAKGVGESGCIGAPPALLNAAIDALAPRGVHHLDMPLTSEKLWRALNRLDD